MVRWKNVNFLLWECSRGHTLPADDFMNVGMFLFTSNASWWVSDTDFVDSVPPFLRKHALITRLIFYLELASVFTSESGWQLPLLPLRLSEFVIRLFWFYTVIWGPHPVFYILEGFFFFFFFKPIISSLNIWQIHHWKSLGRSSVRFLAFCAHICRKYCEHIPTPRPPCPSPTSTLPSSEKDFNCPISFEGLFSPQSLCFEW